MSTLPELSPPKGQARTVICQRFPESTERKGRTGGQRVARTCHAKPSPSPSRESQHWPARHVAAAVSDGPDLCPDPGERRGVPLARARGCAATSSALRRRRGREGGWLAVRKEAGTGAAATGSGSGRQVSSR
jgi:hypothetical protein